MAASRPIRAAAMSPNGRSEATSQTASSSEQSAVRVSGDVNDERRLVRATNVNVETKQTQGDRTEHKVQD